MMHAQGSSRQRTPRRVAPQFLAQWWAERSAAATLVRLRAARGLSSAVLESYRTDINALHMSL